MDCESRERIKTILLESISNYLNRKKKRNKPLPFQPLNLIFPTQRKLRSIIGGLETSMGISFWQEIASLLAKNNGFATKNPKEFPMPTVIPDPVKDIISKWKDLRQNKAIELNDYIRELRECLSTMNTAIIDFTKVTAGMGVDLWIEKDNCEYAFDIKTVKMNQGNGLKFNDTIMMWYAYRLCQKPDLSFKAAIAIPYNPYSKSWWEENGRRARPLINGQDILIEEDFWKVLTGEENTFKEVLTVFKELGEEKGVYLQSLLEKVIEADDNNSTNNIELWD